jgi:hypothetical protein
MQQSTAVLLTSFASFVQDARELQQTGLPLLGPGSTAEIIALRAQVTAAQWPDTPQAFSLLCTLAKFVIGFLLAQESGEISEAVAQQRIAQSIKEVAKHLS